MLLIVLYVVRYFNDEVEGRICDLVHGGVMAPALQLNIAFAVAEVRDLGCFILITPICLPSAPKRRYAPPFPLHTLILLSGIW